MDNSIFTVSELADYLKIQKVTIYKHAQTGDLPGFKVGSNWRFKRESIDEWIKQRENRSKCESSGS